MFFYILKKICKNKIIIGKENKYVGWGVFSEIVVSVCIDNWSMYLDIIICLS